jgi:hypothetical protein
LQALWFLFWAVETATYLPGYFSRLHQISSGSSLYSEQRLSLFFAVLRVILYGAAALALIQYAERVVGWLVRDLIPKQPPNTALEPTAAAPSVSDAPSNPKASDSSKSASSGGGSALGR